MFGMPFHSITAHFPEWYRLVPLRSLCAENQERFFKSIKSTTPSTNFRTDHLTTNALVRHQSKANEGIIGASLKLQESVIAKEWKSLPIRPCTIITRRMVEEDVTSFAAHIARISDYLLEVIWREETADGNWIFQDGADVMVPQETKLETWHIR